MSLLDDARLIQDGFDNAVDPCPVCLREYPAEHHPDCAVRAFPKIVEVIELVNHFNTLFDQDAKSGGNAEIAQEIVDTERRFRAIVRGE